MNQPTNGKRTSTVPNLTIQNQAQSHHFAAPHFLSSDPAGERPGLLLGEWSADENMMRMNLGWGDEGDATCKLTVCEGNSPFFLGKSAIIFPFSKAMLVYQRLNILFAWESL